MATAPLLVALIAAVLVAIVLPLCGPIRRSAAAGLAPVGRQDDVSRIHARVHMGWEQTLIGLARELHLPRRFEDLPYGALYLEPRTEYRQHVRTRSEIGRGFLGLLEISPHAGPTRVDYSILHPPDDEHLHAQVTRFEDDLIAALRRLDPRLTLDATMPRWSY